MERKKGSERERKKRSEMMVRDRQRKREKKSATEKECNEKLLLAVNIIIIIGTMNNFFPEKNEGERKRKRKTLNGSDGK